MVETGYRLARAKRELTPSDYDAVARHLGLKHRAADMVITVGRDRRIAKQLKAENHGSQIRLPRAWRTLVELTKLSDDQFDEGLKEGGIIQPDMERSDVTKLRPPLPPRRRKQKQTEERQPPLASIDGERLQQRMALDDQNRSWVPGQLINELAKPSATLDDLRHNVNAVVATAEMPTPALEPATEPEQPQATTVSDDVVLRAQYEAVVRERDDYKLRCELAIKALDDHKTGRALHRVRSILDGQGDPGLDPVASSPREQGYFETMHKELRKGDKGKRRGMH